MTRASQPATEGQRSASADGSEPYLVLTNEDYRVLGPEDFGGPGLVAVESIGPYVEIQASGPLVTIHDSTIDAHLGIGHHPHRYHERLFYILEGQLDHDDAQNGIQGHMGQGDVGQLTEGRLGMLHSEWNNGDITARAYILVYPCDPLPERASFDALRGPDAPRYDEGSGVRTKELVGPRSPLRVNGDIRLFADSNLAAGRTLTIALGDGEGGLVSVREGRLRLDQREVGRGATVVMPPAAGERRVAVEALDPARILRVVHGPGHGLIRRRDRGCC